MKRWTIKKASSALRKGTATIDQIASETGWPIIEDCLVPEPEEWHATDGDAEVVYECRSDEQPTTGELIQ
jgi:hypothetical protein